MRTELEEITLEIIADKALTNFDSKKLVNWAVKVLTLGYDSENLCILAGLDSDTTEEREKYFTKCIQDLELKVNFNNEKELLDNYALFIANKVVKNEISIDYAFSQMIKVVSKSEFDERYVSFYEIDEDLDYLIYDNTTIFTNGLTLENSKEFILEEFKLFLEMEKLNVPIEERKKCYCEKCKKLNIPITKNKYQFKEPFKYLVWSCEFCGSEKLKFNSYHEVKKMIIEKYK